MADNLAVTPGSGATVAADDIGSVLYQRVKLTTGPDGTANDVSAAFPVPVGGLTVVKDLVLSTDTSIYASGDVIADTQQLDAALRITDGTGLLQSIMVIDKDDQGAAFTIYILGSSSTMGTENAAPSISDANAATILGIVDVFSTDYKDLGGVKVAYLGNLGIPIVAVSGTDDIYVAVVNGTGTPTYTAAGLTLRLGISRD